MKKLLLAGVAMGSVALAAPAHADIELDVSGYFKGYGVFVDQDEAPGTDVNDFDFIRDTELHIGGETVLDNGLTIGTHFEFEVDGADGSAGVDESYLYFSGNWGRVNFGNEDGAGYLLQVAAPSADSNVDGIRQYVSPFVTTGGVLAPSLDTNGSLDYDMDQSGKADKLTYLSPIMNGFQAGVSFSPDTDAAASFAVGTESAGIDETYEIALRYEGQFQNVGVIAGAGYAHGANNSTVATADDRDAWNVGLDLDISAFGIGAIYTEDSTATEDSDVETFVVGADYTTGPFKIGISYLNSDEEIAAGGEREFDRYSGGVVYNYGPGMSFRGSIHHLQTETGGTDGDGPAVLLGTHVNF